MKSPSLTYLRNPNPSTRILHQSTRWVKYLLPVVSFPQGLVIPYGLRDGASVDDLPGAVFLAAGGAIGLLSFTADGDCLLKFAARLA